jgi:group I intron endonuclease
MARPKKSCGIYALIHVLTKMAYIGGSVWIENRFSYHRAMLKRPWHHSKKLLDAWNSTNPKDWQYKIMELCPESELDIREQWWLDNYDGPLLNVQPNAGTPKGSKHTEETKIKMSVAALQIAADPEEIKRRSRRVKKQHAKGKFGRKTWSAESVASFLIKAAIAGEKRRGIKFSKETRAKQRAAWTPKRRREQSRRIRILNTGRKASLETREKQRSAWTPEKRAAASRRAKKQGLGKRIRRKS